MDPTATTTATATATPPETLVLGATGFIGRWLTLELLTRGRSVAVAVRPAHSGAGASEPDARRVGELRRWLREHGADDGRLTAVAADITRPGLGLSPADEAALDGVRDVYNLAALYRFGLGRAEAHAANVDGARHALHWAASRPRLRRLVHLSGYRVSAGPAAGQPLPDHEVDELYARLGAYEASKCLGDIAVREGARSLGVPLTTVNPSSVVGHSVTGEAGQYIGLADLVRQLWTGWLPALPGTARTFVPVVAIDYLARFLAAVPEHDEGDFHAHTVLDRRTPELPRLIALLAEHLGVRAPRRTVPPAVLRRLPRALTGADPETLSFLSEDRYDTTSADRLATTAGLQHPPLEALLTRWAERLVAERFGIRDPLPAERPGATGATGATGTARVTTQTGRFVGVAGSRTYLAGDRENPSVVLLHGLPVDSDAWHGVVDHLSDECAGTVLLADLPGLGRSSADTDTGATTTMQWLSELLAPVRGKPVLVGHSAGSAAVLRYATAHPQRVAGIVLVAPYFLQRRPGPLLRTPVLTTAALRRATPARLATALLGPDAHVVAGPPSATPGTTGSGAAAGLTTSGLTTSGVAAPGVTTAGVTSPGVTTAGVAAPGVTTAGVAAPGTDSALARRSLDGAAAQLRRPGVAGRTARRLRELQRPAERAELAALLQACPVPVRLVVGERDPLLVADGAARDAVVVPAAGHHLELTHPRELAAVVADFRRGLIG